MNVEQMLGDILDNAEKLNKYWNDNKISPKKIRKDVEFNYFKNKQSQFSTRFTYFYAFESRMKNRYSNVFKVIFRYFAWKKDTKLLSKMKLFLHYPDSSHAKMIIEIEIEKFLNGEDCFGSNSDKKNGKNLKNSKFKQNGKQTNASSHKDEKLLKNMDSINKNDLGHEDVQPDDEKLSKKDDKFEPNINDKNPESLPDKDILANGMETVFTEQDLQTREHLEISKDSLTNFEFKSSPQKHIFMDIPQQQFATSKNIDNIVSTPISTSHNTQIQQNISTETGAINNKMTFTESNKPVQPTIVAPKEQTQNIRTELIKNEQQNMNGQSKFVITTGDKNPESLPDLSFFEQQKEQDLAREVEQNIEAFKQQKEHDLEVQSEQVIQNKEFEKLSLNLQEAYKVDSVEKSSSVRVSEVRHAPVDIQANNK